MHSLQRFYCGLGACCTWHPDLRFRRALQITCLMDGIEFLSYNVTKVMNDIAFVNNAFQVTLLEDAQWRKCFNQTSVAAPYRSVHLSGKV